MSEPATIATQNKAIVSCHAKAPAPVNDSEAGAIRSNTNLLMNSGAGFA
jgi:hypothetical protein